MNLKMKPAMERGYPCGGGSSARREMWLGYKLRACAYAGDLEGVKAAYEGGASINAKSEGGWTALDFSVRELHAGVSSYLRAKGGTMGEPVG